MNVREIEKDGVLYIVKFATSKEKQFLLEDEIRNHKLIQSKNVPGILKIEHEDGFNLVTRKVSGVSCLATAICTTYCFEKFFFKFAFPSEYFNFHFNPFDTMI